MISKGNHAKFARFVLKESVSPLVKNEEEKDKEEEGMKLRRRSKIKVSVLFFRPVSYLYFAFSVV